LRQQWQLWSGAVSSEKIDSIISHAELEPAERGGVFSHSDVNGEVRSSTIRWLQEISIRDFLWEYVKQANINAFGFDIMNCAEMQFTEYHASEGGHYDWHHDINWDSDLPSDRKISVTVQLSDPSEYEGGDFQFDECETPAGSRAKGTVLVFPSYLRHRVLPVTRGTRKSLVAWFHGPRWR